MRASVVDEHDTDFWSEAAEIAAQYDEHEPSPVNSSSPSQTIKLEIGNPQTSLTVPNGNQFHRLVFIERRVLKILLL
jgi:hypothetical protein